VKYRQVVVVDDQDRRLGLMEIFAAHKDSGVMHRAISVLLHDAQGNVLLQQRAATKPLWPLSWTNTVCTHPLDNEDYLDCAVRRLGEEMGIAISKDQLHTLYRFPYQATFNQQLSEHELDTVIVGKYHGRVHPDPKEAAAFKWVAWADLQQDITHHPDIYTPWFKLIANHPQINSLFGQV